MRRLSQSLEAASIDSIYTSPLERAVETAEAIAGPHRLIPQVLQDLGELRFGAFEGRTFDHLKGDSDWMRYNTMRSTVPAPGGELMLEAQARMVRTLQRLLVRHDGHVVAIVSHADPLRSLVAYYLGMPIDMFLRLTIDPASMTIVKFFEDCPSVVLLNHTGELPPEICKQ